MAFVAPIHKPSSVRHALKLHLLRPHDDCLVVAKSNRVEVYSQTDDGLKLEHSKTIFGKVTLLNKIRPVASPTDHLFVGTDRFNYFTLSWDPSSRQLRTEQSFVDIGERSARESQTGDRTHVDPSRRILTVEMLEGIITVVPIIQNGTLGEPMPSRIAELFVRSSAFLQTTSEGKKDKPKFAIVYEDSHSKACLRILEMRYTPPGKNDTVGSVEFAPLEGLQHQLVPGATLLIPVQAPTGGLVILGETCITYYDELRNDVFTEPLKEATIFCAWVQVDKQRFVLSDDYGNLYLLFLKLDSNASVSGWKLDCIGATPRASTLVYLDGGRVFVGSHQGDSQLIRISSQGLDILQTFSNIGPILDFTIMDMGSRSGEGPSEYSSGQARIVTGSGAWSDGSIRSVRSGVGLEDLGTIAENMNVVDMFGMRSHEADVVDTLVVACIDDTRIFRFDDAGTIEEMDGFAGMLLGPLGPQTLLAASLPSERCLQVTPSVIRVTVVESGMPVSEWSSGNEAITAAALAADKLLVSVGGADAIIFDLANPIPIQIRAQKSYPAFGQIACINFSTALPDIFFLGFWSNSTVAIVDSTTLSVIRTFYAIGDGVPRSILVTTIFPDAPPTLFIAMADGSVVTFSFNPVSYNLSSRKSVILGTRQAFLCALPRSDGLHSVFAGCENPSLIYGLENRIVYSAITAENVICVCPFRIATFPDAIALATSDDLRLGLIDKERTTHVQTLSVGHTVRRIAYSPSLKAFGIGTVHRYLADGAGGNRAEELYSNFKLVDEILFRELASFSLNGELAASVPPYGEEFVESVLCAALEDGGGGTAERFIVGTAFLEKQGGDAVRGRILVFEVTEDRQLKLVTKMSVKGACRCLAMSSGRIVAALMKSVAIYAFEHKSGQSPKMTRVASFVTATALIDITVTGSTIAVADLMKSVSLLKHTRRHDKDSLVEVARHYQTVWATAVANVDENLYLESDAENNVYLLRQNVDGVTEDDRKRLNPEAEFNLGEMVNRIRNVDVDVVAGKAAVVAPKALMGTVEGSLYLFGLIRSDYITLLCELQDALAERMESPGNVPFNEWRAPRSLVRTEAAPIRFVDGELVERFLDCETEVQQELVDRMKSVVGAIGTQFEWSDVEWFKELIEGLRRLH